MPSRPAAFLFCSYTVSGLPNTGTSLGTLNFPSLGILKMLMMPLESPGICSNGFVKSRPRILSAPIPVPSPIVDITD